eukprot:4792-Heterococcus_DN1.PRE.1
MGSLALRGPFSRLVYLLLMLSVSVVCTGSTSSAESCPPLPLPLLLPAAPPLLLLFAPSAPDSAPCACACVVRSLCHRKKLLTGPSCAHAEIQSACDMAIDCLAAAACCAN